MMNKGKRIALYVVGFGIGCLFAYFTLFKGKNRGYWLPENRVKEKIAKSRLDFSSHVKCLMECNALSEETIMNILKNGNINFQESQTHHTPCPIYIVEGTSAKITCNSCDSTTQIINVEMTTKEDAKPCNCN